MAEENKTKFRLEIDKTIQPKQFEPIKIIVDIEETFYWTDKEDRDKKIRQYTSKISRDFVNIFDNTLKKIGESESCIGKVIISKDVADSDQENVSNNEKEFLFD